MNRISLRKAFKKIPKFESFSLDKERSLWSNRYDVSVDGPLADGDLGQTDLMDG